MKFPFTFLALTSCAFAQLGPPELTVIDEKQPQIRQLAILDWIEGGEVKIAGPLPSFVEVWLDADKEKKPLEFGFNKDATEITVQLPEKNLPDQKNATLNFLITEETAIHPDGTVVLSALDSKVIGKKAKLESHPGSHRIGFWGLAEDFVRWETKIPEGDYHVDLVYSRANKTGTEISISVADQKLKYVLETTGSWYRYRIERLGTIAFSSKTDGEPIDTRVEKIVNGGVMNLKAIILTPIAKP